MTTATEVKDALEKRKPALMRGFRAVLRKHGLAK
jgi:hypothetical protein